jgi:membrane protein DedA with SNARE-associated domain
MSDSLQFLVEHGYLVLFLWVLAEQIGLPIPAVPVLLGAGALAGMGTLDLAVVIGVATAASLLSDGLWFEIGRRRGTKVLQLLCRIALEPDSCVRTTEDAFGRWGGRSLLVAKFVPGLNTMAPPMAGITGMPVSRFLLFDGAGSLLYVGVLVGLGFVFSDQLEEVAAALAGLGARLPLVIAAVLVLYVLGKYVQRRLFLRRLRVARITSDELKRRLDAGEEVVVIDLRHSLDFEVAPESIPGAIHIAIDAIERDHRIIPRDREVVLFCT